MPASGNAGFAARIRHVAGAVHGRQYPVTGSSGVRRGAGDDGVGNRIVTGGAADVAGACRCDSPGTGCLNPRAHSLRRARTGSSEAARSAGRSAATTAQTASTADAPARAQGAEPLT